MSLLKYKPWEAGMFDKVFNILCLSLFFDEL